MAVDPQVRQDILDTLDEVGATMNQEGDVEVITQMDDSIADKIMLPGVQKDDSGSFVKYIQASLAIFYNYVKSKADGIASTWDAWFGTSDSTGVKGEWGQLKTEVNNTKSQAQEATTNANNATTSADKAASDANAAASSANDAASNANEKAGLAQGIYETVASWFNGNSGFKASAESWLAARRTEWSEFFSDSLSTGCRKLWTDFWNSSTSAWNAFFGSSAEDANGVRKIWSNWFGGRQSEWNTLKGDAQSATSAANDAAGNANEKASLADEKARLAYTAATNADDAASEANEKAGLAQGIYETVASWFNGDSGFMASAESWLAARRTEWSEFFSDSLSTGCRKLWTDFWNSSTSAWNAFFGSSAEDANGVRKIWSNWFGGRQSEWNTLKGDAQSATSAADDAAGNANEKASLANGKAELAAAAAAQAAEKAGLAEEKAGLADEKAQLADEKAAYAKNQGDYAKQQGDRAKLMADHRDRLDTDGYIWRYDPDNEGAGTDGYYKTDQYINAEIDPSNMTDEQISEMLSRFSVDFASTQTCETAASDPDSLTEEEKGKAVNAEGLAAALLILNSLVRAPYFEGNTLVFPSTSSMRFEGTTLILAE